MSLKVFLVFLFLPSLSFGSYEDIFDMAQKYNQNKKKMVGFEKEKRDLLGKIYDLEKTTRKIVRDKGKYDREKIEIDEDIRSVSKKIVVLEEELKAMTKNVMTRWVQIQKMNDLPWMYVLLSSYSPSELERLLKTFEKINQSEVSVIKDYIVKVETLNQEKKKLYQLAKRLVETKRNLDAKEKSIKKRHEQRKILLGQLDKKIFRTKVTIKDAKKKGRKLAHDHKMNDLKLLFGSSFFEKKKSLSHPIMAPIHHSYGLNQVLLKDNIKLLHKGLFYKSSEKSEVRSIGLGRVKHIERKKAYGSVVIVDHGSNYYSVYSHLKTVGVKKGDVLEEGASIGRVGNYNAQFGSGLYFEIRHFSEPEDPSKWLKKQINKDKMAKI